MGITQDQLVTMDNRKRINLVNSLPGFKCLQMVATLTSTGTSNLSVVNSLFHISSEPPLLGFTIRPQSTDHDTLSNILESGAYTFNTVHPDWYEKAHQTSARYPAGVSEFVECGFTEYFASDFDIPFVAESRIKIAMKLREIIPIATIGTSIVIGEIVKILCDEKFVGEDGYIKHEDAETVTVTGLDSYFTGLPLARLAYAKPDLAPRVIETAHIS